MNHNIEKILEHIPVAEVAARLMLDRNKNKEKIKKQIDYTAPMEKTVSLDQFETVLKTTGIGAGDIVIVHSSMGGMRCLNASPMQILQSLQKLVGPEGTVVFPVFPCELVRNEAGRLVYDMKRSKIWTGLLPFVFLKMKGTVRSRFPFNSLSANGRYAEKMMEKELESDLAHGKNSAWGFCVEKHAKVLYLGVHVWQADTLLHVAEDYMDTEWPIHNWYKLIDYTVYSGSEKLADLTVRCRDGKWHKYFASYHSGYVLRKNHLIQSYDCGELIIETIPDSKLFTDFVINQAKNGKTFYHFPPWL